MKHVFLPIFGLSIGLSFFCFNLYPAAAIPQCGQSLVLGAAQEKYDSPAKCTEGGTKLEDAAKDDLITNCDNYCKFLTPEGQCQNSLQRANLKVPTYDCKKLQADDKVHARAVLTIECICKTKE